MFRNQTGLKRLLFAHAAAGGELPTGYKQIAYIQAEQYAYIATNYTPVKDDEITVRFMSDSISTYNCLFSAGNNNYQLIALGNNANGLQDFYCKYFASGSAVEMKTHITTGTWQTMTVNSNGRFDANGVYATSPYENEIDGGLNKLFIFRRVNSNYPYIGKLSSFTIANNGRKKLDLIPCLRTSDNVAGAYDAVSKTFYSSASPNEQFIPGINI